MAFKRSAVRSRLSPPRQTAKPTLCGLSFYNKNKGIGYLDTKPQVCFEIISADFAIELIEELLKDNELALTEENIRFYDKGTTAETDENLDDHIRWRNARYYNEDSNVVRSSLLIVQLPVGQSAEYINFHVGELYRIYRKDGMNGVLPIVKRDIKDLKASATKRHWPRPSIEGWVIWRWSCISAWATSTRAVSITSCPPWFPEILSKSGD